MTRKRKTENELPASPAAPVHRKSAAPRTRAKRALSAEAPVLEIQTEETAAQPQPELAVAAVTVLEPSHEEIASLAYSYWVGRGFQGGSPEEDWLRAEQELKARSAAAAV